MTTPTPSFDKEKYELRSQVIPLKTDKLSQLEFNESFLIGRSSSKKSKKNRALNPDNFLFDDAAISREHLLGYLYRIDLGTMEYKLPLVKDVSQHGSMILKYGSDTAFKLEKNTFVPLQEGDIIGLVLTRVNAPTKKSSDNIFKNTKLQFQVFFNQEDSRLNLIKLNTSPFAKDFKWESTPYDTRFKNSKVESYRYPFKSLNIDEVFSLELVELFQTVQDTVAQLNDSDLHYKSDDVEEKEEATDEVEDSEKVDEDAEEEEEEDNFDDEDEEEEKKKEEEEDEEEEDSDEEEEEEDEDCSCTVSYEHDGALSKTDQVRKDKECSKPKKVDERTKSEILLYEIDIDEDLNKDKVDSDDMTPGTDASFGSDDDSDSVSGSGSENEIEQDDSDTKPCTVIYTISGSDSDSASEDENEHDECVCDISPHVYRLTRRRPNYFTEEEEEKSDHGVDEGLEITIRSDDEDEYPPPEEYCYDSEDNRDVTQSDEESYIIGSYNEDDQDTESKFVVVCVDKDNVLVEPIDSNEDNEDSEVQSDSDSDSDSDSSSDSDGDSDLEGESASGCSDSSDSDSDSESDSSDSEFSKCYTLELGSDDDSSTFSGFPRDMLSKVSSALKELRKSELHFDFNHDSQDGDHTNHMSDVESDTSSWGEPPEETKIVKDTVCDSRLKRKFNDDDFNEDDFETDYDCDSDSGESDLHDTAVVGTKQNSKFNRFAPFDINYHPFVIKKVKQEQPQEKTGQTFKKRKVEEEVKETSPKKLLAVGFALGTVTTFGLLSAIGSYLE